MPFRKVTIEIPVTGLVEDAGDGVPSRATGISRTRIDKKKWKGKPYKWAFFLILRETSKGGS